MTIEGAVAVASSPSPVLHGALAGLRGVALLRRIAADAAGTAATGLLVPATAEGVLRQVPLLGMILAALLNAGQTALRLRGLAAAWPSPARPQGGSSLLDRH